MTYFGKDENDKPIYLYIKNNTGFDIDHNKAFNASVKRCYDKTMSFIVPGVIKTELKNNWFGIEILNPGKLDNRIYYILHSLDETISFEKPLNCCGKIWLKAITSLKNPKSIGRKLTLAVLPKDTKVIVPSTSDHLSRLYNFKCFCLVQDYITFNPSSLNI
jgi:hypothetical protein